MEKISITRALAEIKILEKKIDKKIGAFVPTVVTQGKRPPTGYETIDKFKEIQKAEFQSIKDLINRRSEIKRKIVLSNATTKVKISDESLTIAEVIDYKSTKLIILKKLNDRMITVFNHSASEKESQMMGVNAAIDRQLEALYGRDKKVTAEEVSVVREPYLENNGPKFIECIDIQKENKNLVEKIDEFVLEVDHILSESNATTFIKVE